LYLDNDGIEEFIKELDRDTKAIKQELLKLCWYMRGGLSYTESHCLIPEERELISKIVDENLETTKESGLPFF
jgi:DNA polymerase III delta subunit